MFDEKFWLAIAFFTFIALIFKYAFPLILAQLDAKSKQIAEEILAAKEAKEKAKYLLESAERHYQEAVAFADKLLKDSATESQKFLIESQKALESEIAKKMDSLNMRIKQEQDMALREMKTVIIASAIKKIEQNLQNAQKNQLDSAVRKAADNINKMVH